MLQEIPENQKKLSVLEQERNSARKIYQDLLSRQGQAEVTKQMEIGDKSLSFRLVDPAILPTSAVWPNMELMIALAIFGGLGGAFGIVLLIDNLSTSTINSVEDLVEYEAEILGVVPFIYSPEMNRRKRLTAVVVTVVMVSYYASVVGLFFYEFLGKMGVLSST